MSRRDASLQELTLQTVEPELGTSDPFAWWPWWWDPEDGWQPWWEWEEQSVLLCAASCQAADTDTMRSTAWRSMVDRCSNEAVPWCIAPDAELQSQRIPRVRTPR
jgi:hypothetical protein